MKLKIMISVFQDGEEYFATRTFLNNMPSFLASKIVFSITDEVALGELWGLEERARQEARSRGITNVLNLD